MNDDEYYSLMNRPSSWLLQQKLKKKQNTAKKSDINVIIAIHGYGSHGYGGEIRKEIHKNLILLKSGHQIVDFIKGEQWSDNNPVYLPLTELEPELILNNQIGNLNSGVTIVWVKK